MPMKTMIGMQILEMTASGLQEIVTLETEPLKDPEDWKTNLSSINETIYNADSIYMTFEDQAFVIKGLATKTIVLKGVFQNDSYKPGSQA